MQSNFINNEFGAQGLRYLCDTDTYTGYDIAVCGPDAPINFDGIAGVQFSSHAASIFYPAGNIFGPQWNIFNNQLPINYWYNPLIPHETPVNIGGAVIPYSVNQSPTCNIVTPGHPSPLPEIKSPMLHYAIACANVNYYMTDSNGSTHRDSLYYWASQIGTAYGALLTANLLIEDSLIDSANTVYNAIITTYTLDSIEANDFILGRGLMDVLITNRINNQTLLTLDSGQVDTLQYIAAIATMWAHARAESWLNLYNGTPLNDTLLYPNLSAPPPIPCPGVLTVTELSNGPALLPGCNYAELIVSGCGACSSPSANVQGWIIDDNSGNFNLNGCTVEAGITQSHYRLAYDSAWASVPVGSAIVVYNVDSNCYALPDTFTVINGPIIDSTDSLYIYGNVYFVPLGGTEISPLGRPHMERFRFTLDSSLCTYVVDTTTDSTSDSSYYAVASDWQNTINLDTSGDAIQVRCPRCGRDIGKEPAFYHGFGYGIDTGDGQFNGIPPDSSSLGGPVLHNRGGGHKYCFMGSTATDLGDSSKWQLFAADAPGSRPHTLGTVNGPFATAARNNSLNLPCCDRDYRSDSRKTNKGGNGNNKGNGITSQQANRLAQKAAQQSLQSLNVFPSPTTMTLNFQYSLQDNITIKLFDVTGRIMDEHILQNSTTTTFNVASYVPGIYLYQVITGTTTQSGKVVIGK